MGNSRLRRRNRQWVHDFKRDHSEEIEKQVEQARKELKKV